MKQTITLCLTIILILVSVQTHARAKFYRDVLCKQSDYYCLKVKRGQSWLSLFPDPEKRDIVKRVNRMNKNVRAGMRIAVPKNINQLTVYDVAPFPRYIDAPGEKTIFVSQKHLAWGAYDKEGELVWWGPMSSGKDFCPDVGQSCKTPPGEFRIIRKQGIDCVSTAFPRRASGINGGAAMPFCMHFFRGYAFHGSYDVVGRRASHGCVRLFIEDAQWLNREFIELPGSGRKGTRVVIEDVIG